MSSRKTSLPVNTDSVSSKQSDETTTTMKTKAFKSITKEHVHHALTYYLRSLMMIGKDEEVTYFGVGDHFTTFQYKTEKMDD